MERSKRMDLTKLHYPYDFANPVSDVDLFIGRNNEMDEIRYYLNHAKLAPRPINIALLGPRASGKTSILNITEIEAQQRDFCVIRIDLDEGDAKIPLNFFYKLFDGILSQACDCGAFGGKEGKTYDRYLDAVSAYLVPEDKTFCPFIFPLQYAKAMSSQNFNVQISDYNFKKDLLTIRSGINRPVVILFDEGNILGRSRILLEKMRNMFMNTPGFMLIITGTPDIFPLMDEVFSPIVRQFKKINVGGFERRKDTEDCIRKPLEKVGINPEEIFDFETLRDVEEIHDLSGGRPYEIQLICHKLFQRIQLKKAAKMKIDLSLLEEVLRELETSQDITTRPILSKICLLNKKQLAALSLFCVCESRINFEQLWVIEYVFNDEKVWTKDSLRSALQNFVESGIINISDNVFKFCGDDFDKIYSKYFAREQKVSLGFPELSPEIFWDLRMQKELSKSGLKEVASIPLEIDLDTNSILEKLSTLQIEEDIFVNMPSIINRLYFIMVTYRNEGVIPIIQINLSFPWMKFKKWYVSENPTAAKYIDGCLGYLDPLVERTNRVGGELLATKVNVVVIPVDIIAEKIEKTANERLRNEFSSFHEFEMIREYVDKRNPTEALFHGRLSYRYNKDPDPSTSNNLGYLFMSSEEFDKARQLLERAIKKNKSKPETALPIYNLGILDAKTGRMTESLGKIRECIEILVGGEKEKEFVACLFVAKEIGENLIYEEVIGRINILEVALQSQETIEKYLKKESS
jgi:hypothetical protein